MGQRSGRSRASRSTPWIDVLGGFITRHPGLWTRIGNLETRLLEDELSEVAVERPIYVAGLARSGSTILLELLARQPEVVSHRYRDYPPVFTPYMWNRLLERTPQRRAEPAERSHKDGIKVTPDSPEALEEVLWMAFFPQLHDPADDRGARPRDRPPRVRELLPRPHPQAAPGARRPALSRQGQLQRHPARIPAQALPGRTLRDPGARAASGTSPR